MVYPCSCISSWVLPLLYSSVRILYIWLTTFIMALCPYYVRGHLLWCRTLATHFYYDIMPILLSISNGVMPSLCTFIMVSYPRYAHPSMVTHTLAMHIHPGITSLSLCTFITIRKTSCLATIHLSFTFHKNHALYKRRENHNH